MTLRDRVLGIDFGSKRIGVAITDGLFIAAHPLAAIMVADKNLERAGREIGALATEHGVRTVVLGLPLLMDGTDSPQTKSTREFGELLTKVTGLEVEFEDERLTSVAAEDVLLQTTGTARRRARARKAGTIDVLAARMLLQTWMERVLRDEAIARGDGPGSDLDVQGHDDDEEEDEDE